MALLEEELASVQARQDHKRERLAVSLEATQVCGDSRLPVCMYSQCVQAQLEELHNAVRVKKVLFLPRTLVHGACLCNWGCSMKC